MRYQPLNCGTCGRFVTREDSDVTYDYDSGAWEAGYPHCGPGRGCRKDDAKDDAAVEALRRFSTPRQPIGEFPSWQPKELLDSDPEFRGRGTR